MEKSSPLKTNFSDDFTSSFNSKMENLFENLFPSFLEKNYVMNKSENELFILISTVNSSKKSSQFLSYILKLIFWNYRFFLTE